VIAIPVLPGLNLSVPVNARELVAREKRPGCEVDHSTPSTAEVKNGGAIPPAPHVYSWRDA
jgi:hypothetical protein